MNTNSDKLSKIIEKIRRCLALSQSSNEHEAALALEKARELMERYSLEDGDIHAQTVEDIIELDLKTAQESTEASIVLGVWIGKAFFTQALVIHQPYPKNKKTKEKVIRFIGTKSDVAVSSYVFCYMMNLIEIKSDDYFQETVRPKQDAWTPAEVKEVKAIFALGFAHAVVEKLREIEEANIAAAAARESEVDAHISIECKALAVIKLDLIKRYMDEHHPNAQEGGGEQQKVDANHFRAGYAEGEKTGIFRGVATKTRKQKVLK